MTTGNSTIVPYQRYTPDVVVSTENLPRDKWLEYRRQGIGGSDVGIILGVSPYNTTRDLYYDKLGIKHVEDIEDNWVAKEVGHRLESLVAEIFQEKTGLKIIQIKKMFRHPKYRFMLADVDFFIETEDRQRGILEIKTAQYSKLRDWEDNAIPYNYELQTRHYMAVMDLDFAYIACLFSNSDSDYVYRRIERDREFEATIIEMEQMFWEEYIVTQIPPPYTEKGDMILESIRRHIGAADTSLASMTLTNDEISLLDQYFIFKSQKSALEAKVKELDNAMKRQYAPIVDRLGKACEASATKNGKKYLVHFRPQYRTGISKSDLEKLKINNPDIYNRYAKTKESRSFRAELEECS